MGRDRSKVLGRKLTGLERIRNSNKNILKSKQHYVKVSAYVKRQVRNANRLSNPLKLIDRSMTKFPAKLGATTTLEVRNCRLNDLTLTQQDECFKLVKSNVRRQYEAAGWGWNPDEKRKELFHPILSRYLVCFMEEKIVGFVHYRFDVEVGNAVLYCYEIHVIQALRGQGIGRHLMNVLIEIARRTGMKKVMLTVLKTNSRAVKFYENLQFTVDKDDPVFSGFEVCYHLYSKLTECEKRKSVTTSVK